MSYYLIAAYILSSILLAYLGRNARLRFWGVLLASLVFSPLIVGVVLLFFSAAPLRRKTVYQVAESDSKQKSKSRS
jgi:hypothetical protein